MSDPETRSDPGKNKPPCSGIEQGRGGGWCGDERRRAQPECPSWSGNLRSRGHEEVRCSRDC
eukprot:3762679-Rhodomonas_salina.1